MNPWKLLRADEGQGHFEAKIGMSIWTWGETVLIEVSKTAEGSVKVNVRCEAYKQIYDWARKIDKDIEKFFRGLEVSLNSPNA